MIFRVIVQVFVYYTIQELSDLYVLLSNKVWYFFPESDIFGKENYVLALPTSEVKITPKPFSVRASECTKSL